MVVVSTQTTAWSTPTELGGPLHHVTVAMEPAYRYVSVGLELVGWPGGCPSSRPPAHVVARVVEHYCCLAFAGTITCCSDPRALPAALVDARPTLLCGPPRVWLGMRAAAEAAIARGADPIRGLGLDRLGNAWTAGAPIPPDLVEFFRALGVPLNAPGFRHQQADEGRPTRRRIRPTVIFPPRR
jgi:hypothetical protein